MNSIKLCVWHLVVFGYSSMAFGHGTPIDAFVHPDTRQLAVFAGYEPGVFDSFGGSDVFTDAPGIGISSVVNGFEVGDTLRLNVVQGLLYWNGSEIASTTETLLIDWPDDGGASSVETYEVTAESGYMTGLTWGNYQPPGGTGSWDAHGDYALDSRNPATGVYGVVLQLAAEGYVNSEPFLLPLVYDPSLTLSALDIAAGVTELEQAVTPLPDADFDRDTVVGQDDLAIWQSGYGKSGTAFQLEGDATLDFNINGADFLDWQRQFSASLSANSLLEIASVPEPNTFLLSIFAVLLWSWNRSKGFICQDDPCEAAYFIFIESITMMKNIFRIFAALAVVCAPQIVKADAIVTQFRAELDASVVQPQKSEHASSTATAVAEFVLTYDELNPAATTLTYDVQFTGLDVAPSDSVDLLDDVTAIHIHDTTVCANAALCGDGMGGQLPGSTAGTKHVLNVLGIPRNDDDDVLVFPDDERVTGIWDPTDANNEVMAPSFSIADPAILDLLFNGNLALMVHTKRVTSGEIGGFIRQIPEPTTAWLASVVLGIVSARRHR